MTLGWFLLAFSPEIEWPEYPEGSYLVYIAPPPYTTWLDLSGLSCSLLEASFGRNCRDRTRTST
jgi:hypothetical protein